MVDTGISRTAEIAAAIRALHQRLPIADRIFVDPLADRLADLDGPGGRLAVQILDSIPASSRGTFTSVLLRSRYAEDRLREAVLRGVGQYAIVGAGFDSFPYRQPPWATGLRIVEFDQPATQQAKRERLARAGITVPGNVAYSDPCLGKLTFRSALEASSLNVAEPTFVSMLGVSQYLRRDAFDVTMRSIASLPSGSEIVLTVVVPPDTLPADEAAVVAGISARASNLKEPFRSHFVPEELRSDLLALGFAQVDHLSPERADALYFSGRQDGLRAPHAAQLLHARV